MMVRKASKKELEALLEEQRDILQGDGKALGSSKAVGFVGRLRCEWRDADSRCGNRAKEFYEFDNELGMNLCNKHYLYLTEKGSQGRAGIERNYWIAVGRLDELEDKKLMGRRVVRVKVR